MTTVILLTVAIFAMAILYSSVGHAGASGYLAAMAIVTAMPQEEMKAVALTLNIFVGTIGSYRFIKAGHFDWRTFWPFAVCAVPLAFVGGLWKLPPMVFKPLIGVVLLYAAIMLALKVRAARRNSAAIATPATMPIRISEARHAATMALSMNDCLIPRCTDPTWTIPSMTGTAMS